MKKFSIKDFSFKKPKKRTIILSAVLLVIIIALLYINSHPMLRTSIIKFFNPDYTPIENEISIENPENTLLSKFDDNILLVSPKGITALNDELETEWETSSPGGTGIVDSNEEYYIQYFTETNKVYVSDGDDPIEINTTGKVITASVNKNGYFAIVTEERGYKGLITVYNDDGEEIYKWHSADKFITDVTLSENDNTMVASTLHFGAESQSVGVTVFKYSNATPLCEINTSNDFIADIKYLTDDEFICIGNQNLTLYSNSGSEKWNVSYDGEELLAYTLNDDILAVANRSLTSIMGDSHVSIFDHNGKKIGGFKNSEEVVSLDCYDDIIMLVNKKSLRLADKSGEDINVVKFAKDIKSGVLFGDTGNAAVVTGNMVHSVRVD